MLTIPENFHIQFHSVASLITSLTSLMLGGFVYYRNRRSTINRSWFLMSISVVVWSITYGIEISINDYKAALFLAELSNYAAMFIPVFYFNFLIALIGKEKQYSNVMLLMSVVTICLFASAFAMRGSFIPTVGPKFGYQFFAKPGVIFHIYFAQWILSVLCSFAVLIWEIIKKSPITNQLLYVLLASSIGFISGISTFFGVYTDIYPWGVPFVFFYVLIIFYAIVKHQLMDISIVITRATIFIFVYSLVLGLPFLLGYKTKNWFLSTSCAMVLMAGGWFVYTKLRLATERLLFKEEKLKLAETEQSRRQTTMDTFSASLAHEIINPVYAIAGLTEVVKERVLEDLKPHLSDKDKAYFTERFGQIIELSQRMDKMIKAIREFSAKTTGKFTTLKLSEVIDSCLLIVGPRLKEEGIQFNLTLEPNLSFSGNKILIEEVLINLAVNAVYAVKQTEKEEKLISLTAYRKDNSIIIEIKDNGIGIKKELLEDIFLDFVTTKPSSENLGMGLSRARKIVQIHKGKIWAQSPGENQGATIYIELTLTEQMT